MSSLLSSNSKDLTSSKDSKEPDQKIYQFRYTLFRVIVVLKSNQFAIQIGIKAYVINLNDLFAIYRRDLKSQGVSELTLAYKHNKKIKRARIYADKGEEEFEAFHQDLKKLKPGIDISDLPEKKAYAQMGTQDQPWLVVLGLMGCSVILLAILGLPLLIHGLDQGEWTVTSDDIYQNPSILDQAPSRNLNFSGRLNLKKALIIVEGKGDDEQKQIIAPMYPTDKQLSSLPALILVSIKGRALKRVSSLEQGKVNQGILRNIWWEGLGETNKLKLKEGGLNISQQAVLIEMGITQRDDLQLYLGFIAILSFFTTITVLHLKPATYNAKT